MTGLLALVAGSLGGGLGGAVTREMADLATVVALLTLGAVTRHVPVATAGVAGLSTLAATTTISATISSLVTSESTTVATGLGAVACNVSNLGALVALLGTTTEATSTRSSTSSTLSSRVGAVTADVAG